mmetsp:Transcript_13011/g.35702  ORF Transcript_13011/g.35702 Transcript_13011/m.35702 type:complete len:417 (-) Transcript_13011:2125-3375(-)
MPEGVLEPPERLDVVAALHGNLGRELARGLRRKHAHARRHCTAEPLLGQLQLACLRALPDHKVVPLTLLLGRGGRGNYAREELRGVQLARGSRSQHGGNGQVEVDLLGVHAGLDHSLEPLHGALGVAVTLEAGHDHSIGVGVGLNALGSHVVEPSDGGVGLARGAGGEGGEDGVVVVDAGLLALCLHTVQPLHGTLAVACLATVLQVLAQGIQIVKCRWLQVSFHLGQLCLRGLPSGVGSASSTGSLPLGRSLVFGTPRDVQVVHALAPMNQGRFLPGLFEAIHCHLHCLLQDAPVLRKGLTEHAVQQLVGRPNVARDGVAAYQGGGGSTVSLEARRGHGLQPLLSSLRIARRRAAVQHGSVRLPARRDSCSRHLGDKCLRRLDVPLPPIAGQKHIVGPFFWSQTLNGHPFQPPFR